MSALESLQTFLKKEAKRLEPHEVDPHCATCTKENSTNWARKCIIAPEDRRPTRTGAVSKHRNRYITNGSPTKRRVSNGTSDPSCVCVICNSTFENKPMLVSHMQLHVRGNPIAQYYESCLRASLGLDHNAWYLQAGMSKMHRDVPSANLDTRRPEKEPQKTGRDQDVVISGIIGQLREMAAKSATGRKLSSSRFDHASMHTVIDKPRRRKISTKSTDSHVESNLSSPETSIAGQPCSSSANGQGLEYRHKPAYEKLNHKKVQSRKNGTTEREALQVPRRRSCHDATLNGILERLRDMVTESSSGAANSSRDASSRESQYGNGIHNSASICPTSTRSQTPPTADTVTTIPVEKQHKSPETKLIQLQRSPESPCSTKNKISNNHAFETPPRQRSLDSPKAEQETNETAASPTKHTKAKIISDQTEAPCDLAKPRNQAGLRDTTLNSIIQRLYSKAAKVCPATEQKPEAKLEDDTDLVQKKNTEKSHGEDTPISSEKSDRRPTSAACKRPHTSTTVANEVLDAKRIKAEPESHRDTCDQNHMTRESSPYPNSDVREGKSSSPPRTHYISSKSINLPTKLQKHHSMHESINISCTPASVTEKPLTETTLATQVHSKSYASNLGRSKVYKPKRFPPLRAERSHSKLKTDMHPLPVIDRVFSKAPKISRRPSANDKPKRYKWTVKAPKGRFWNATEDEVVNPVKNATVTDKTSAGSSKHRSNESDKRPEPHATVQCSKANHPSPASLSERMNDALHGCDSFTKYAIDLFRARMSRQQGDMNGETKACDAQNRVPNGKSSQEPALPENEEPQDLRKTEVNDNEVMQDDTNSHHEPIDLRRTQDNGGHVGSKKKDQITDNIQRKQHRHENDIHTLPAWAKASSAQASAIAFNLGASLLLESAYNAKIIEHLMLARKAYETQTLKRPGDAVKAGTGIVGQEDASFTCYACGSHFTQRSALITHMTSDKHCLAVLTGRKRLSGPSGKSGTKRRKKFRPLRRSEGGEEENACNNNNNQYTLPHDAGERGYEMGNESDENVDAEMHAHNGNATPTDSRTVHGEDFASLPRQISLPQSSSKSPPCLLDHRPAPDHTIERERSPSSTVHCITSDGILSKTNPPDHIERHRERSPPSDGRFVAGDGILSKNNRKHSNVPISELNWEELSLKKKRKECVDAAPSSRADAGTSALQSLQTFLKNEWQRLQPYEPVTTV